ncbi:pca operon transcription factor PcaQ [Ralstonia insidiosa]|uniref:Pca operon transcription factor PcaQ n=1 Tax=Ralstonia insidiosa TaxID=190721 RepID=A0A191ZWL0_9RALS|nr:pca operon transcription factor PcaQ [Ralstonia insidiosa]ANJ72499.1 pca operon transcription factor PcaQ [Ralstonia insidiosa]KAB0473045.1 pca operon transcription factor PcaQ [Ralstonia insidiosa]MBY4911881.1 pca operon transcription factor PcaQ [Ralstonia insidiosa]
MDRPALPGDLPSRIRFRHLSCFVAIAQERNLRRAAERLHLSQPAVSKTLGELEALAGVQLVERGRQGARLTAAGEQFLRHAVGVTQALESATAALMGSGEASAPVVHVGALPTVASGLLPQAIAALHAQRPHAGVRLRTGTNAELLAALKAGELDFVVGRMAEPTMMQGLSFELLYAEALALVVRPQHPLALSANGVTSLQAVLDYPLVIATPGTVPRHHTDALFQTHGLRLPAGVTETLSVSVARLLARRSDAIWITPERAAQDDLSQGWLTRLNLPTPGTGEPVGLLRRSAATPTELADAFMETLRALAHATPEKTR